MDKFYKKINTKFLLQRNTTLLLFNFEKAIKLFKKFNKEFVVTH